MPVYTLQEAEEAIRARFRREGRSGDIQYDSSGVVESPTWIYVPCGWIGCKGCIVSKADGYVNWLGSALKLDDCLWGHERGLFHDLVDFELAPQTSLDLVARLLDRFKHMHPNSRGKLPEEPVWYRDSEIAEAVSKQFPFFKRHFVWFGIPEIRVAVDEEGLVFKSVLSPQ